MSYTQPPWYRDRWVGLVALFAAFVLWPVFYEAYKKYHETYQESQFINVPMMVKWELENPTFGTPGLRLRVWHQYPDNLENGVAVLTVRSKLLTTAGAPAEDAYSFPSWSPNEENAREFFVPFTNLDYSEEVKFDLLVDSRQMHRYHLQALWDGENWIQSFADDHEAN